MMPRYAHLMRMLPRFQIVAIWLIAGLLTWPVSAIAEEVDLELVLAMDASGSISHSEYALQLKGTAAAFRDPAIHAAIQSGPLGKIAVSVMLWSDAAFPKVDSGWFVLDGPQSASRFAGFIQNFQLTSDGQAAFGGGGTGIGAGVEQALKLLETNRYQGLRRVIDVSGDGVETEFWFSKLIRIAEARRLADANNVTVNGLPILTPDFPDLDRYYRENVITGPGAFVEVANDFDDFARALKRKLLREITTNLSQFQRADPPVRDLARLTPACETPLARCRLPVQ